jgi:hypothetical protein
MRSTQRLLALLVFVAACFHYIAAGGTTEAGAYPTDEDDAIGNLVNSLASVDDDVDVDSSLDQTDTTPPPPAPPPN